MGGDTRIAIVMKIQLDATVHSLIYFTAKSLYTFSVQVIISIQLLTSNVATLEGSSCTDIMTCNGGCGYSF